MRGKRSIGGVDLFTHSLYLLISLAIYQSKYLLTTQESVVSSAEFKRFCPKTAPGLDKFSLKGAKKSFRNAAALCAFAPLREKIFCTDVLFSSSFSLRFNRQPKG
jgi:hypothetical protein